MAIYDQTTGNIISEIGTVYDQTTAGANCPIQFIYDQTTANVMSLIYQSYPPVIFDNGNQYSEITGGWYVGDPVALFGGYWYPKNGASAAVEPSTDLRAVCPQQ